MDFIHSLGLLAIASRFKRMTGILIEDGQEIYNSQGIVFEPRMFTVYNLLYENKEGMQISEIAKALGITHPAVIKISNIMIKQEMLTSLKDERDARKNVLQLTDKALSMYHQLRPVWDCFEQAIRELCAEIGYDVTDVLLKMENALSEKAMAQRVIDVIKAKQYDAITILNYTDEFRIYFKKLNYEWLNCYFAVEPYDEKILSNPEEEIVKKGGEILFAELNSEIVGTCALVKIDEFTYELCKMAVKESQRGKQIGRKLLDAAMEKAKSKGVKRLVLITDPILKDAVALYRKNGFKMLSENHTLLEKYIRSGSGFAMYRDL